MTKIEKHFRLIHAYNKNYGGLTKEHIDKIASHPETRLELLLVRCGNGRFLAPAQDVQHFIDIITKENSDYVRDVSIPSCED